MYKGGAIKIVIEKGGASTESLRSTAVAETWIHHYTSGTKILSKQWTAKWGTGSKTSKNSYYTSLIYNLKAELAEKRPHLQKKKILFHQDNPPPHTPAVVKTKIHELLFELLDHLPYSPDLAPRNFFLSLI
ncbi:histone-lysine N-methyltransferase SETMAR [Trichonephila clavipes]|nr:histone-lysine N-methyltransferase SETMAR [Trichonephila clavipes]